ncbi:unnamed protein product, partial [marine sediment metagenome]
LKPATDPNDFLLIETFGMGDGTQIAPIGEPSGQVSSYTRKQHIYHAEPVHQASFGASEEESQWTLIDENVLKTRGYGWPDNRELVPEGTGSHFMDEVTIFKSTVSSLSYIVSPGYSMEEEIKGLITGTTVEGLYENLLKADTAQRLKVIAVADGAEIVDPTAALMDGDTLVVLSADSLNISKYILDVTVNGLSDDAVLTSTAYTVAYEGVTGSVTGFDYGITVRTVADGVTVPAGAHFAAIDSDGKYVPYQRLNFDTVYVDVLVTDQIYFEVIAEDGA